MCFYLESSAPFAFSTVVVVAAGGGGIPVVRRAGQLKGSEAVMKQGEFGAGRMKPKVEAALQFLESGGKRAIITAPEYMAAVVRGRDEPTAPGMCDCSTGPA
jgi:carbamate kinase